MKILFNFMKLSEHHVEILKTAESWINEIGYKVKTRDNGNIRSWVFQNGQSDEGNKPFSISIIVDDERDITNVDIEAEDEINVTDSQKNSIVNQMFGLDGAGLSGPPHQADGKPVDLDNDEWDENSSEYDNEESSNEEQINMFYDSVIKSDVQTREMFESYNNQREEEYEQMKSEIVEKLNKIKYSGIKKDLKIKRIINTILEYWDDDDITKMVKTILSAKEKGK